MRIDRSVIRGLIVAVALILLLPIEAGGSPVVKRTKSARIKNGLDIAKLTARCPKGTKATGGGYKTPAFNAGKMRYPVVFESRKAGQRAWRVRIQLTEGSQAAASVRAYVLCRKGAPATDVVKKTMTVTGSNEIATATKRCAGGDAIRAGGFSTPPPSYAGAGNGTLNEVFGSLPSGDDGWSIRAVSGFSFAPFTSSFTVYAYCSRGKPLGLRTGTKKISNPFGASEFSKGTAKTKRCPGYVTAGGFSQKPVRFGADPRLIHIHAVNPKGSRLAVSGTQAGASGSGAAASKLKAIAVCG